MNRSVTIIMYHYILDARPFPFAHLNFFPVDKFEDQVLYLKKAYNIISGESLIESIIEKEPLPPNSALLTFDDGYLDHYRLVLPILERHHLQACFFPITICTDKKCLLDVNKIQLILACNHNIGLLTDLLFSALNRYRKQCELAADEYFIKKLEREKLFFDTKQVNFFKRMLQRELPDPLRLAIIDEFFQRFVSRNEAEIAEQFYMGIDEIRHLHQAGMTIGNHGFSHPWHSTISPLRQEEEIDASLKFLSQIGVLKGHRQWIFSYPFGDYNAALLAILEKKGCVAGLTTEFRVADLNADNMLTLPRIDTKHISW